MARVLKLHPLLRLRQHQVVGIGAHLDRQHPPQRQIKARLPAALPNRFPGRQPRREHRIEPVDLRLDASGCLLGLSQQSRQVPLVFLGKNQPGRFHGTDFRTPGRLHQRLLGGVAPQLLPVFRRRNILRLIGEHHICIEKIAQLRGHRCRHLIGDTAAVIAVGMDGEVGSARFSTELRQPIGPEARVDRLVGQTATPHAHHLRRQCFRPLLHHRPLLLRGECRIEFHIFHPHLTHAKRRGNAHDKDRDAQRATELAGLVRRRIVVPHLVGEHHNHHVAFRHRCAKDTGGLGRRPNRRECHLDP